MADPAKTIDQNILPVQALFNLDNSFNTFIGQGQPFYATINPVQSGLTITNSTIDSSTIGATTPSTGVFTNVSATTGQISTTPSSNTDITNKFYVDSIAQGLSPKQACKCATTANITLSGLQTIDGYTTLAGDRVLVKNQGTSANNGIYIASSGTWSRSTDMDVWSEVPGAYTVILNGTINANSAWVSTSADTGTINVTPITFVQFSGISTYYAGTGLTLSSNTFSITNTGVTAGTYGSASQSLTAIVNAQGQLTSLSASNIALNANQITSGTIASSLISGSYTGITGVGTLTAGTWNANTIGVAYGGTGATTFTAGYLKASGTSAFSTVSTIPNSDITGLGTMSTQNANAVAITGGTISGLSSPLAVASGGTGAISLTGYIKGSGTTAFTASTTIPTTDLSGTITNAQLANSSITINGSLVSLGGSTTVTATATNALTIGTGLSGTSYNGSTAVTIANTGVLSFSAGTTGFTPNIATTGAVTLSGTLSLTNGGTNASLTAVQGGIVYSTASALAISAAGTTGQFLQSNGTGAPTWATPVSYATVTDDTTTNGTRYPLFANQTSGSLSTEYTSSTKLQYNPSTGVFTSTSFSGAGTGLTGTASSLSIGGNAATATSATSATTATTATNLAGGANGSLPYQTGSGATTFLAAGTNTQILTLAGGVPTWANAPVTGITITDDTTTNATRYITFTSATSGTITGENTSSSKLQYNPSTGTLTATTFSGSIAGSNVSGNISGNAANVTGTVAIGNGGTGQTTASAAFNALSPITTAGDLIIGNGTNSATRLGIGSNTYILTSNGTTASWQAPPSSMVYPGAGIPNSTGSAWGTSYSTTGSGTVVALATSPTFSTSVLGDFSNATVASRTLFKTSTTNATTGIYAVPNGTATAASWQATNAADPTNASKILIATNGSTDVQLVSGINGTGTYLPLSFYTNGSQSAQLDTSANFKANGQLIAGNGIIVNSKTVSASYSIPSGSSAMSSGPITVSSGVTVTVASGSRWVVL